MPILPTPTQTFTLPSGERTSLRLEPVFAAALRDIALRDGITLGQVIVRAEAAGNGGLASAVRVHIASYYRAAFERCEAGAVA